MKVIGECIYSGSYHFNPTEIYELDINEIKESFEVVPHNNETIVPHNLSKLDIYFKLYQNINELKLLLKDNLQITDDDILEYKESGETMLCVRYKHDFIYFDFVEYEYGYPTDIEVKITSNNLARQKTMEIELFKDDIIEACKLIKFLQK